MAQLFLPQSALKQESFARTGGMLAFLSCLTLIPAFAGAGAYIAMFVSVPVTLLVLFNWQWFRLQGKAFPLLFATAYAILAAMIAFSAQPAGNAIYVFDFIPLLLAIGLYVGLSKMNRDMLLMVMAYGCLAGVSLSFIIGAYQVFGLGMLRAQGIGGIAIYYANITLLLGFLALAPLFSDGRWRWSLALAPVLAIAVALMSGSRSVVTVGAALFLVAFIHALIWGKGRTNVVHRRRFAFLLVGVLTIFLTAILLTNTYQTDRIAATFAQAQSLWRGEGVGDKSLEIRFDFYQSGFRAFLDNPILGHGLYQSADAAAPYMKVYDRSQDPEGALRHLHNDVIEFAVSFGVPGVLSYLLIVFAPIWAWFCDGGRKLGVGSYSVFSVTTAYLAMGLTDTNFLIEAPQVMFCFAAAGAAALASHGYTEKL